MNGLLPLKAKEEVGLYEREEVVNELQVTVMNLSIYFSPREFASGIPFTHFGRFRSTMEVSARGHCKSGNNAVQPYTT